MRIRTLLNRCQKYKSFSFVKETIEEIKGVPALIVEIGPRRNGRLVCSGWEKMLRNMIECQQHETINSLPSLGGIPFIFVISGGESIVKNAA